MLTGREMLKTGYKLTNSVKFYYSVHGNQGLQQLSYWKTA